jgi:DNA invertase Pin-like site-specific DNA recombinase
MLMSPTKEETMDLGLARVSSLDQDPTIQLHDLEQAGCWPIVSEKISGVAAKRPVRDQALAQLKHGDTLTCWKLDRLGRSMVEVVTIVQGLQARGVRFRCLTQHIDTSSATGMLQLQLLAAFAEFERQMIRERTLAGRARRAREGLHPGGPALYGFAKDHVTILEHEAALVRYVAEYVAAGAPMNQVVDVLNWRGYRTREGKLWTVKTLRRILGNQYIVPILGQDQYDTLAKIFNAPGRQRMGRPAVGLMSGILSCGRCDGPLTLVHTLQRDGTKRDVYACRKQGAGGRFTGCGSNVVGAARVDAWAEDAFIAAVAGPDFAQALNQRQAELLAEDTTAAELDAWREELGDIEQVQGTRYYSDAMQRRHADLRRMVDRATAQLMARPDMQALVDLPRSEDALRDRWASWSTAQRRTWLKRLVSTVVVSPASSRSRASVIEDRLDPRWRT